MSKNKKIKIAFAKKVYILAEREGYNEFEIIDYAADPQVDDVYLLLIRFENKDYGLCIYNAAKNKFVEEPGDFDDYDTTTEKLSAKYGFKF